MRYFAFLFKSKFIVQINAGYCKRLFFKKFIDETKDTCDCIVISVVIIGLGEFIVF